MLEIVRFIKYQQQTWTESIYSRIIKLIKTITKMKDILFENKITAFRVYLKFSKESRNFLNQFIEYVNSKLINFESQKIHKSIIFPTTKSEFDTLLECLADFLYLNKSYDLVLKNLINEGMDLNFINESILNQSNLAPHEKHNFEEKKIKAIEDHEVKFNMISKSPEVNEYKQLIETIKKNYKCPISKLNPNFSTNFYEQMICNLINQNVISKKQLNKDEIYHWVQNAFFFEKKNVTVYNENLTKLNWISKTSHFANWMFFIKNELVTYNETDYTQFNDWMCMHFEIKGESIIKGVKSFSSIKKYLIEHEKDTKSNYFSISNNHIFNYTPKKAIVQKANEKAN